MAALNPMGSHDAVGDQPMADLAPAVGQQQEPRPEPHILQTPAAVQAREAFSRWSSTAYLALTRSGSHADELDH